MECKLFVARLMSPIGQITIESCTRGVHKVDLQEPKDFLPDGRHKVDFVDGVAEEQVNKCEPLAKCVDWIKAYFKDASSVQGLSLPPLHITKYKEGSFTAAVLHNLATKVDIGETVSYGQLATMTGNTRASRAVGGAMRANQTPLLVPCHRVVNSNGSVGNFMSGKGNVLKKWLLEHEATTES
ncbi:methylated-DNA--protein-cysteine methyltransferase-like [Branchiostoma lanceolatum]|uniref:methylated-DNA--protein-cysteine methyltransferase-like n=1 Tax=Branchiostoma lanceolatum TaxID=7740 RepID=UPI0034556121